MSVRRGTMRAPPPAALPGTLCGPALALATGVAPAFGRQTGATGVAKSRRATQRAIAENDSLAFSDAVEGLWNDVEDKFAKLRAAIRTIRERATNSVAYSDALRENNYDYHFKLFKLVKWTLPQSNDAIWYDLKTDVVALLFDTTGKKGLEQLRRWLADGEDGPDRFPAMLQRVEATARARDDASTADKAEDLRKRLAV